VGRKNRVRIAAPREAITVADDGSGGCRWTVPPADVRDDRRSYPAVTTFVRLAEDEGQGPDEDRGRAVLLVRPVTGRRHQIRVHLAWIGHAIDGDPLFDRAATGRTHLHAWRLAFDASWSDGHRVTVEAPPGADFWAPVAVRLDLAGLVDRARRALGEKPPGGDRP
jgi:hypothetical protein